MVTYLAVGALGLALCLTVSTGYIVQRKIAEVEREIQAARAEVAVANGDLGQIESRLDGLDGSE